MLVAMRTNPDLAPLFLAKPRLTLAVAESLTCGQVQAKIGAVAGASRYFLGGITAYSLAQKVRHLGVNRAHAQRVNSVSQRVAVEMAEGAGVLFGADLGLATTGYAEPSVEHGVAVPMAWWALCHRRRGGKLVVISGQVEMPGADRVTAQARVVTEVLAALVIYLQEFRRPGQPKIRA
jgi:nicotinamide-nucleotide amidase